MAQSQYCVYYKLTRNATSWNKFHLRANSSEEAIAETIKPFSNYPGLTVLGAPLTSDKRKFEMTHGIK